MAEPLFDGAALGREVRRFIFALLDIPEPREAVGGKVEIVVKPAPQAPTQEKTDG